MTTPFQKAGFKPDDVFRFKGWGKIGPPFVLDHDDGTRRPYFQYIGRPDKCPFYALLDDIELAPEAKRELGIRGSEVDPSEERIPEVFVEVLRDMLWDPYGVLDRWEVRVLGVWQKPSTKGTLVNIAETFPHTARRKPKRITATCMDGTVVSWPEPMREAPEQRSIYWLPNRGPMVVERVWNDLPSDRIRLTAGYCHATEAAAIEHAEALTLLSKGGKKE